MFKVEINNEKIGKYLSDLIEQQYRSKREFCRAYIRANGEEPTENSVASMANRLSQIIKGRKQIQLYDLPHFSELLGISCEQILSAGECSAPVSTRVTNYSIACSKDPCQWQKYIDREDKLILNSDEYNKTVLDYAIEFANYDFIKYLMDNEYIWFINRDDHYGNTILGANTSIKHRELHMQDSGLQNELLSNADLRIKIIAMAADQSDTEMLDRLRAREDTYLDFNIRLNGSLARLNNPYFPVPSEQTKTRMIRHIANSNEKVLEYFTDTFEIEHKYGNNKRNSFIFPDIAELLDQLIAQNSSFAEKALKKALHHNQNTYEKLRNLALRVKNDAYYSKESFQAEGREKFWNESIWINAFKSDFHFDEQNHLVSFTRISTYTYTINKDDFYSDSLISNVVQITKTPVIPELKKLAEELNKSYERIKNFADYLKEM